MGANVRGSQHDRHRLTGLPSTTHHNIYISWFETPTGPAPPVVLMSATRLPGAMVNLPATGAAVLAAGLFGFALLAMTARDLRVAGFCFLSAALVIYVRETYLLED